MRSVATHRLMANKASAAWRLAILLGLVLQLAAVQANMMTMRREVDGQRRLARVGMLVMKIKTQNMMWMMRLMSDEHNDEARRM